MIDLIYKFFSILELELNISAYIVLGILFFLSLFVWTYSLSKIFFLIREKKLNQRAISILERYHKLEELNLRFNSMTDNNLKYIFQISYDEINNFKDEFFLKRDDLRSEILEILEKSFESNILLAEKEFQKGQAFFATVSITAPFIGLFGTILGVIKTFQDISELNSIDLTVISPGIAEALIATAAGIFTALPAAFSYNMFRAIIRDIITMMNYFSIELLKRTQKILILENEKIQTSK